MALVQITVRYWGGAARAAGTEIELVQAATLRELRAVLAQRPDLVSVSRVASLLVDGAQFDEDADLSAGAQVDVLPPFAGG